MSQSQTNRSRLVSVLRKPTQKPEPDEGTRYFRECEIAKRVLTPLGETELEAWIDVARSELQKRRWAEWK